MVELKLLEGLRTKKEVKDYFKKLGKEISDKEIQVLKSKYENSMGNDRNLSVKQLDNIAGGMKRNSWHSSSFKNYGCSDAYPVQTDFQEMLLRHIYNKGFNLPAGTDQTSPEQRLEMDASAISVLSTFYRDGLISSNDFREKVELFNDDYSKASLDYVFLTNKVSPRNDGINHTTELNPADKADLSKDKQQL